MKALEIVNLHKNFKSFNALIGINFSIEVGECLGLLGTNGAGKSTTIKIITGQLGASSGSVKVFGLSPETELKRVHEMIGLVPEGQSLYEEVSVHENLEFFRGIYQLPKERTTYIVDKLGLCEKLETKVKDLSKGLRQRVLIGRAIIHAPKFLLLDEPTSGLDPGSSESIYQILNELKEMGTTILLTTHLMNDGERLCDKIVFIHKGKVVAEGTPKELKGRYRRKDFVVVEFEDSNGLQESTFNSLDDKDLSEIFQISKSAKIRSINSIEPKLEDIFIQLTEGSQ